MDLPQLHDWSPDPNTIYPITQMPLEVQQMAAESEAILEKWRVIHSASRSAVTAPDVLFHYTDVHGMHGIVFNPRQLWLTDFRATNDPSEGRHALMLLEDSVKDVLPPTAIAYLEHVFKALSGQWGELQRLTESMERRFFTSISESSNELSLWVHYGARGAGYCIGLRTETLLAQEIPAGEITLKPRLIAVEYDAKRQRQTVASFVAELAACHAKHAPMLCGHQRALGVMHNKFKMLIKWFASTYALDFKNSHFNSEREWRYVVEISPPDSLAASPPLKTRARDAGVAWYLPIGCSKPKSIIAGPKVDYEQFRAACAPLLLSRLNGVDLSKSDIPLR